MDRIDLKILKILQSDATVTVAEIAEKVALSATPCWKRIQKLETSGVLRKRVGLVSGAKIGLGLTVHISIQTGDHAVDRLEFFVRSVSAMPEVIEFSRLAGEIDYVLKVVTTDISAYDAFYKKLTALMPLRNVTSHFELQSIKSTTALPLDLIDQGEPAPEAGAQASQRRVVALRTF
jgi:Lrp/AsnC family transcriptional regulator